MRRLLTLLLAAADGLAASPARGLTATLAVAASLFPLLSGLALSEGLRRDARAALIGAADLFVAADAFGSDAPLQQTTAEDLESLPGVVAVAPRLIGRARVADRWIVVVGVDGETLATLPDERRGPVPAPGEVFVGRVLARKLGWGLHKRILLEAQQTLVLEVAKVFDAGAGLGSANAVVLPLADAQELFARPDEVSDLLVYCRPGYQDGLAAVIAKDSQLRVQTRALVGRFIDRAYDVRAGSLMLLFAFALAVLVPVFILIADFGMSPRRREVAIMKASGWSTSDVLILALMENVIIALLAGALAVLLAFVWIDLLGAPLLRSYFIPHAGGTAGLLDLPAVFRGWPAAVGVVLALTVTTTAGAISVWRTAVVPPSTAMRS